MNTASNVAMVLADITKSSRFASQQASNKVSVDRRQFYDMVDYRNIAFAQMINDTLIEEANKHGFARRYLNVIRKSIGADSQNKVMTFDLNAEDKVEQMEEQFASVQKHFHVAEDVEFFQIMRQNVKPSNVVNIRREDMLLKNFLSARSKAAKRNSVAFVGNEFMNLMISGDDYARHLEPTPKFESLLIGHLGLLVGTRIDTDAYRPPTQKCIRSNEIFFLPEAENLGDLIVDEQDTPLDGINVGESKVSYAFPSAFSIENLQMQNVAMINIID